MSVKFISHVDEYENGKWFIKLTDTLENSSVICDNLKEYQEQIENLGSEYGNDIEVVWTKSKELSLKSHQELNEQMAKLQEEYADEINKIKNQDTDSQGGFNPNA